MLWYWVVVFGCNLDEGAYMVGELKFWIVVEFKMVNVVEGELVVKDEG